MANLKKTQLADKLVANLRHEYVLVGKSRIRAWHLWLIVGVLIGIMAGVYWVASRSTGEENDFLSFSSAYSIDPLIKN